MCEANWQACAPVKAGVTLSGLSQTYDGSPRVVTATTDPVGVSVALTYDGSATAPTNAGSYAIVATVTSGNYVGGATGTLTVAKATAPVALSGLSAIYDGTPKSVTATTTPSGLTVNVTYDGSATAPTNAGSYAVVATVNAANYTGTAAGTLVIGKDAAAKGAA